jgi:hypothetical protein
VATSIGAAYAWAQGTFAAGGLAGAGVAAGAVVLAGAVGYGVGTLINKAGAEKWIEQKLASSGADDWWYQHVTKP